MKIIAMFNLGGDNFLNLKSVPGGLEVMIMQGRDIQSIGVLDFDETSDLMEHLEYFLSEREE